MPGELREDTGFQDGNPWVGYYEPRYETKGSDVHSFESDALDIEAMKKRKEHLRAKGTFMGMVRKMRKHMEEQHIDTKSKGDVRARSLQ